MGQFRAGNPLDDGGDNLFGGHQACQGRRFPWASACSTPRTNGRDRYYCNGNAKAGTATRVVRGWGQGIGIGHRNSPRRAWAGWWMKAATIYTRAELQPGAAGILRARRPAGPRRNDCVPRHAGITMGSRTTRRGRLPRNGGNDRYDPIHYVAMGMAWDESTTIFIDRRAMIFTWAADSPSRRCHDDLRLCLDAMAPTVTWDGADPARATAITVVPASVISWISERCEDVFPLRARPAIVIADPAPNAGRAYSFFVDAPTIEGRRRHRPRGPLEGEARCI